MVQEEDQSMFLKKVFRVRRDMKGGSELHSEHKQNITSCIGAYQSLFLYLCIELMKLPNSVHLLLLEKMHTLEAH